MSVTAIVCEDETVLRADLMRALHEAWPELEIVAEAEDGASALEEIAAKQPNVVFLDIRMPGLTGLDVANGMRETAPHTAIVFVTAYQQYAIDAFEKGALDYVLKPINKARLNETVSRLKARLVGQVGERPDAATTAEAVNGALTQIAASSAPRAEPLTWITASAGRETRLIMLDDIAYFQADSKYTVVMTADGEALIRKPIKELLDALDHTQWKQVHRSTIVNLRAIRSIARDESGKGIIKFRFGSGNVTVSQPFMHLFRNM
jgi:DNA-binding LytR/AlgR family response regulator